MLIRRERPDDIAAVDAITRLAFVRDLEASLLAQLREDEGWLPALSLVAAEATGEQLVALLGDPAFYRRFGFVAAAQASPDPAWGEHFQVRTFGAPLAGTFRYAAPFQTL